MPLGNGRNSSSPGEKKRTRGESEPPSSPTTQPPEDPPAKKLKETIRPPEPRREKYYFNLPGNMTGDIWHLAAAMSLSEHFASSQSQIRLKTVIGVVKTDNGKGKYEKRSPALLDFLTALNLPVKTVDVPNNKSRPGVAAAHVKATLGKRIKNRLDEETKKYGKYSQQQVIDQKVSTTVLMEHVRREGKDEVIGVLQERLPANLSARDMQQMDQKIQQIEHAIHKHGGKKVVLLNRRSGDVNKQHNTTDGIEGQLIELAKSKNMFVLGVATPDYKKGDIDLFDTQTLQKNTFVDKRRTAYFWKKVSELPDVHGLIGGRSGSMDIAAFMGVRVFCWDENLPDDEQYLRLLQTYPLMSIGFVDDKSKNDAGSYNLLQLDLVSRWLDGEHVWPKIPKLKDKVVSKLEGAGVQAYFLRNPVACPRSTSASKTKSLVSTSISNLPRIPKKSEQTTPRGTDGARGVLTPQEKVGPEIFRLPCLRQDYNTCGQRAAYNALSFKRHSNDPERAAQRMADYDELHKIGNMPVNVYDNAVRTFLDSYGGEEIALVWSLDRAQRMLEDETLVTCDGDYALYCFLLRQRDTVQVVINTHAWVDLSNAEELKDAKSTGHYFAAELHRTRERKLRIFFADSLKDATASKKFVRYLQELWGRLYA